MYTIILRNKPRTVANKTTYSIEVLGDSPVEEAVRASIKTLEHHPATNSRRNIIDMLGLIERHNFRICHTEHTEDADGLEHWLFVLQG